MIEQRKVQAVCLHSIGIAPHCVMGHDVCRPSGEAEHPECDGPIRPVDLGDLAMLMDGAFLNDAALVESFVEQFPIERVPSAVLTIERAKKILAAVQQGFEGRLALSGLVAYQDPERGDWYDFSRTGRGEFEDLPGLFAELERLGLRRSTIHGAVTGARITDLEEAATQIFAGDPEKVDEIKRVLRDHRVWKNGPPHLKLRDVPHPRAKKAKEITE